MHDGNQVVRGTKEDNDIALQLQEFAQQFYNVLHNKHGFFLCW